MGSVKTIKCARCKKFHVLVEKLKPEEIDNKNKELYPWYLKCGNCGVVFWRVQGLRFNTEELALNFLAGLLNPNKQKRGQLVGVGFFIEMPVSVPDKEIRYKRTR